MGKMDYSIKNLEQCIKDLFINAENQLDKNYNFKDTFTRAIEKDIPHTVRIFSRWDNDMDCFSAISLSFWRIEGSKLIVELAVYDRCSGYKASVGVACCSTPDEVLDWLKESDSIPKCIESACYLISILD